MTTRDFRGKIYTVQTITGDGQTIRGKEIDNWIEAPGGNNIFRTGNGDDVVLASVEFVGIQPSFPTGDGGPSINYGDSLTPGNNTIVTGAGNDYVFSGPGDDIVYLGSGNNVYDGTYDSNDQIYAGSGNDVISTGNGNTTIRAGGGNNQISIAAGNFSVSAGSGNDLITTFPKFTSDPNEFSPVDVLLSYLRPASGELLGDPYQQTITAGQGDNQIELFVYGQTTISTGSGADFVLAASATRGLAGGAVNSDSVDILTRGGNDTIITLSTKSLIKAGSGDDLIFAGRGDDTIYDGSGDDIINCRDSQTPIPIPSPIDNLGWGRLFFGGPAIPITPAGGNDTVYLGGGQDTIILGSTSFVTIQGFSRNDRLDVSGLEATFTRVGGDTLINSGSSSLGVLKGYTGPVGLV